MLKFKGISSKKKKKKKRQNLLDKFSINADKKWLGINAGAKYSLAKTLLYFTACISFQVPSMLMV